VTLRAAGFSPIRFSAILPLSTNVWDCPNLWCIGYNVKNALPDTRLVWDRTILQPGATRYGRGSEYRKGLNALVMASTSM